MKKFFLLIMFCASLCVLSAGAQSLADIAKQSKARQQSNPNAKVIDNDIIPSSPEPDATPATPAASDADSADARKDDKAAKTDKPESKEDADKKAAAAEQENKDALRKEIEAQKKEITQLEREINVAQREAGVRAATYYADAGVQLRDPAKYAEETRKSQAEIDSKQEALAQAKQKLEDLQEQARKTGIPSTQVE